MSFTSIAEASQFGKDLLYEEGPLTCGHQRVENESAFSLHVPAGSL